ncbi:MAG: flagellar basal body P-ring formation chaperone FlgA [Legionella sp.]|nr:flagellar basal body P-ring formation chaperone FlgA [Legionella sp.]
MKQDNVHGFFSSLFLFILLFCCGSLVHSQGEFESLDRIKSAIESFIKQNTVADEGEISVQLNSFDAVKLPQCPGEFSVSFAKETRAEASTVVLVECPSREAWRVFVPIQVQNKRRVLTVNRVLTVGDIISEHDLAYQPFDVNRLYEGYFIAKNEVIGLSVARTISPGYPLTKKNLKQLPLVRRNQRVTLILKQGAIEITMIGIAKSDGYLNDTINVLNPTSKKVVDAVVVSKDRVEITV